VTETREIDLELRGQSCFVAAVASHSDAASLGNAPALEKEKVLLSVVELAHDLLEASIIQLGENLSTEERLWIDRGISIACEEWLRSPEDINTVGV
jgi:hypothetical protein